MSWLGGVDFLDTGYDALLSGKNGPMSVIFRQRAPIFRRTNALTPGTIDRVDMKFNQTLFVAAASIAALLLTASCYRQAPCKRTPGVKHAYAAPTESQSWSQGAPGQRINTLATSPGPGWLWLDGCWYWNDEDWIWLSQQWMPPGGSLSHVGPEGSDGNDYCVYTPEAASNLPIAVAWPPDVNYGRTTQIVFVHGDYGSRNPEGWHDHNLPPETVRDHRGERPRRGRRPPGTPIPPDRNVFENPRPEAPVVDRVVAPPRPQHPSPPSGLRVERRPKAPSAGPVSNPSPPIVHGPTRPAGPRRIGLSRRPAANVVPRNSRDTVKPIRGQHPTPPRPTPPKVSSPRRTAAPAGRARPPARLAQRPAAAPSRPSPKASGNSRPSPKASGNSRPSRRQR